MARGGIDAATHRGSRLVARITVTTTAPATAGPARTSDATPTAAPSTVRSPERRPVGRVVSGGTESHLMLIDLRNKNLTGKKAQETLDRAHITLNKNAVPFDDKSPFVTSGIRVGVPAITTRGMNEQHMETVVDLLDKVLMDADSENTVKDVSYSVKDFMKQFPLYPEL